MAIVKELAASPEQGFVLQCAQHFLDPGQFPLPQAASTLDWEQIKGLLEANGLVGQVARIGIEHSAFLPGDFQLFQRTIRLRDLFKRDHEKKQIREALTSLQEAVIPVVVLKGWAYIYGLYGGDYSLRRCNDIDLLVPPGKRAAAEAVITRLGYASYNELWPGERLRYDNTAWHFSKPHLRNQFDISIDLHWGLFNLPYTDARISLDEVFARSHPLEVCGVQVLQLSPEDAVLHACGHLMLHHQGVVGLNRYLELALLIRQAREPLDLPALIQRAVRWNITIPVRQTLLKLEDYFPATLSPENLDALHSLQPTVYEEKAYRWTRRFSATPLGRLYPIRWTPAAVFRILAYLFEAFIPSPHFMVKRYGPARFWPRHYVRRLDNTFRQWKSYARRQKNH